MRNAGMKRRLRNVTSEREPHGRPRGRVAQVTPKRYRLVTVQRRSMADQTDDPHVLASGHAPTPFTADEIRDASGVAKPIRRLVDDAGGPSYHLVSRYLECDDVGATMERARFSLDGAPLGDPQVGRVTWLDLQTHASFPADATTIESEVIDTAIGDLDCLRY